MKTEYWYAVAAVVALYMLHKQTGCTCGQQP
jgi:hypothetical protein